MSGKHLARPRVEFDPGDVADMARLLFRDQQPDGAQRIVQNCHPQARYLQRSNRRGRAWRTLAGAAYQSGKSGDGCCHPNDHDMLRHG
jgi:hypothetical protein